MRSIRSASISSTLALRHDAGVVDEPRERAPGSVDGLEQVAHLGLDRHVGLHQQRLAAERLDLPGHLLCGLRITRVVDDDPVPEPAQGAGRRGTDAATRAGNQGDGAHGGHCA
jgi:hypothetical protein